LIRVVYGLGIAADSQQNQVTRARLQAKERGVVGPEQSAHTVDDSLTDRIRVEGFRKKMSHPGENVGDGRSLVVLPFRHVVRDQLESFGEPAN
jgi:hypothetical protein